MSEHTLPMHAQETTVRGFWAEAHVDGRRAVTETGETVLSALALAQCIVDRLAERGDIEHGQIEIVVRRAP